MTPSIFTFLSAMFGVLVALGIARLIQALGSFATSREPVRVHWAHGGWILFMLVVYLHLWWSLWDLRTIETWHYFGFLYLLVGPATLYLATSLIVPSLDREEDFDSRGYYLRIRRKFFITLGVATVWATFLYPVLTGERDPVLGWLLLLLAVFVGLAVARSERVHVGLTLAAWALFLASVIGFGLQYGG